MAGVVYICGWWGIPAVGTTVYNSVSGLTFVYCMFRVEVAYESLVTSLSPRGESQSLCVFSPLSKHFLQCFCGGRLHVCL